MSVESALEPASTSADGGRGALDAMLAEYNSLRQESLSAIANRITVANFAFGAAALVIAALFTRESIGVVEGAVALLLVPQIAKSGLLIWLGEYNRSQRAGKAVSVIETKINAHTGAVTPGKEAMVWEGRLIDRGVHMVYPYLATIFLLLGASWVGAGYGLHLMAGWMRGELGQLVGGESQATYVMLGVIAIVAIIEIVFAFFVRRKWRQIQNAYRPGAEDLT
jgi:hypothetical protein